MGEKTYTITIEVTQEEVQSLDNAGMGLGECCWWDEDNEDIHEAWCSLGDKIENAFKEQAGHPSYETPIR